jgi:hypothetical protein
MGYTAVEKILMKRPVEPLNHVSQSNYFARSPVMLVESDCDFFLPFDRLANQTDRIPILWSSISSSTFFQKEKPFYTNPRSFSGGGHFG